MWLIIKILYDIIIFTLLWFDTKLDKESKIRLLMYIKGLCQSL